MYINWTRLTCILLAWRVYYTPDVYITLLTCIFHAWRVYYTPAVYITRLTCILHAWRAYYSHDVHITRLTCILLAWRVYYTHDMYITPLTCILHSWRVYYTPDVRITRLTCILPIHCKTMQLQCCMRRLCPICTAHRRVRDSWLSGLKLQYICILCLIYYWATLQIFLEYDIKMNTKWTQTFVGITCSYSYIHSFFKFYIFIFQNSIVSFFYRTTFSLALLVE